MATSYKDYNDYELLYLICENNENASNILYEKYHPIIEMKAKKYYHFSLSKGLDYNDLLQEGMIGLSEAIRDFREQKDVQFSTFASLCIEREISSAVIKANRQKHKLLNESLSLDEGFEDSNRPWIESLLDDKEIDPIKYLVDLETGQETYNMIRNQLTDFENEVFKLKIENNDYKEIAKKLNKSYKSIDCAIQRIKGKLRKIMQAKH